MHVVKMANSKPHQILDEESLTRQPEEVFDILHKLGEGSYGSVYKAMHKGSGKVRISFVEDLFNAVI